MYSIKKSLLNIFMLVVVLMVSACVYDFGKNFSKPKFSLKDIQPIAEKVLYCEIGQGEAKFGNEWHEFSNKSFTVYKEGRTNIKLRNGGDIETKAFQVILNNEGQKILFCPILNLSSNDRVSCQSLYFLEDDLESGFRRTINLPNVIKESAVTCSYRAENLKKLLPAR